MIFPPWVEFSYYYVILLFLICFLVINILYLDFMAVLDLFYFSFIFEIHKKESLLALVWRVLSI